MTKKIENNKIEVVIHILIWGSLFTLIITQIRTLGSFKKEDSTIYYPVICGTLTSVILFYFNALYLIPHFISENKFIKYISSVSVFYLGVSILDTVIDHFFFTSYFSTEEEPLLAVASMNFTVNLLILSFSIGYGFSKIWISNEKIRQRLTEEKLNAELKFLKAQINPHFLFNTLNMAYSSAIKSNATITADIIEKLSVFLRYILYENTGDKVPLENEINHIDIFINLQLQRLSPEITEKIKYHLKGNWNGFEIAPMILIPLIENVFKHSVMLSRKSAIEINLELQSDMLILETKNTMKINNGTFNNHNKGIGLNNVRRRLQIIYPNQHHLEIEIKDDIYHSRLELKL